MSQFQNTAILSMDSLHLAVPQTDIVSVDVLADAKPHESTDTLCAAMLDKKNSQWPVYAFTDKLTPLNQLPSSCRFFACMQFNDVKFAIACDAIELIKINSETQQQNLPQIMQANDTPVLKLMNYQQNLAIQSNATLINSYLESLGADNVEHQ